MKMKKLNNRIFWISAIALLTMKVLMLYLTACGGPKAPAGNDNAPIDTTHQNILKELRDVRDAIMRRPYDLDCEDLYLKMDSLEDVLSNYKQNSNQNTGM